MSDFEHRSGTRAKLTAWLPRSRRTPGQAVLESLAPLYDEAQHEAYLNRLENVVDDPRNRNIAVSGRYGTGKSSVLDKFQEKHSRSTLRLAVSTLAPDAEGATLTNRIQKEVLKQLVYSTRSRTLRHSRFSRRGPLPRWRALIESAGFVGVLGALLVLFGRLPPQMASGPNHSSTARAVVWAAVAVLLVVVVWVLRTVTYDRFTISEVSAAGAKLALSARNRTYFDDYLDEIVYVFDQEPTDFVIFEDLDRYNDPQIFQALRELNTLLNSTPKRRRKIKWRKKPLRFIYAVRDSLFEQIGKDTAQERDDAARAETVRANRTKFFEVVIPIVPFISHRTAREHLHQLLQQANVDIERPLIELVAKHATDKRLLLNIRNEYLVFAERLLQTDKAAPGLSASHLFALVAYKNFHLEDFENIARRSSDLDRLYDYHRELVATSVANREQAKRDLLARSAQPPALDPVAEQLGKRLMGIGEVARDRTGWTAWQLLFVVASTTYNCDDITRPTFWEAVAASPNIAVQAVQNPEYNSPSALTDLTGERLDHLFPEILHDRWEQLRAEEVADELQQLDRDIEALRGASFSTLVNADKFTITVAMPAGDDAGNTEELSFGELADRTLKSSMARDLVKHGYIDQNFTLYAAQFYGDFTGVDVATFIVQTAQPNTMDINYQFTSPGAIANLLAEADEDFTRSISAYNVQVVDYLLEEDTERADEVVTYLTSNFRSEAEQFLAAFFTSDVRRTQLAAHLSRKPWRGVFTYLASNEGVPADVRAALMDAALKAAAPTEDTYDLGSDVRDFIASRYREMPAFTESSPVAEQKTVVTMLQRVRVRLPSLDGVYEELRERIVYHSLYELTADNLRTALAINGQVALDSLRGNDAVYHYCLDNLGGYLDAVIADDHTDHSTLTAPTLLDALKATYRDKKLLRKLISTAAPDSSLERLTDAPESTWPELAKAKLFRASLENLDAYRAQVGEIDESLGELLLDAGKIYTDDEASESRKGDAAANAAVAILNARRGIPQPADRVRLVSSLDLAEWISPTQIAAEESDLFALLLEDDLVYDNADTFAHLRHGGWTAVGPAIAASNAIKEFLTPSLIEGIVAEMFDDPEASGKIGHKVLGALAEFVPNDDDKALAAAARFAVKHNRALPVDQLRRIAAVTRNEPDLTVQLLRIAALAANEIVDVLNALGGKYSYLTTWERDEFEVPYDEAHRAVFKTVAEENLCRTNNKPSKGILIVKKP
ncbi:hypothetical protein [Nocardia sp. BMG51109]|uniref:YobI family P-loop NTPase n=1 Tax=Nocardia sp. BMG51109 TaxID=1056816 RepID=UPI0004B77DD4|nr:hypothetical protein [Nocardia sp. BMG51109]